MKESFHFKLVWQIKQRKKKRKMFLNFIFLNFALVVVNGGSNCRDVFDETSLLNADTFAHDVSHGIHSLSVEDVDIFFGVDISNVERNGIPTVNLNISDVEHPVMDNTPVVGYEKVKTIFYVELWKG